MDSPHSTSPTNAHALAWSARLESGDGAMDAHHRDFVEIVNAMLASPDGALLARVDDFIAHAQSHFGSEDAMMRGSDYASAQCHLDEHQAVIASGEEVRALVATGNLEVGRRFARELARWFPEHTIEMDQGLAAWALKKRLGGARVVIRRRSDSPA